MATDADLLEEWADEIFESLGRKAKLGWSVNEVRCPEPGCPPVETVLIDLSVKQGRLGDGIYKVLKPNPEVTREDLLAALQSPTGMSAADEARACCKSEAEKCSAGEGTAEKDKHGEVGLKPVDSECCRH
mmetsp:Transcript_75094/g.140069  ORF Transcript_75094/g.140069 Transcript_75094/m.140069 type:complete len:130 (-) Transcript_75094:17-406(-)